MGSYSESGLQSSHINYNSGGSETCTANNFSFMRRYREDGLFDLSPASTATVYKESKRSFYSLQSSSSFLSYLSSFRSPRTALSMSSFLVLGSLLTAVARGQQAGTLTTETHPALTYQTCTSVGECTTVDGKITLDGNWRWTHSVSGSTNCYTGNTWDSTLCPDDATCATNCALDGAEYEGTYGISTSGGALTLDFVTGSNVGSRVYLMEDDTTYKTFDLRNQEFAFDVDVSQLPCGLNGALYMTVMDSDGGMAADSGNKAGAKYGTGYCDAQCPRDLKFINGAVSISQRHLKSRYQLNCHRGTLRDGMPLQTMQIPEPETTAHVVLRWIFGKPTQYRRPLPPTLLTLLRRPSAVAMHVGELTPTKGLQGRRILMDVISTLIGCQIPPSMELE